MTGLADLNLTAFDVDRLTMAEADIRRWVVPISEATVAGGRGRVYETAERFRRRLDRAEAAAVQQVIDAWTTIRRSMDDELNRLDQLIKAGEGTDGIEAARRRLTEQRQQLIRRVDDYARQVAQTIATTQATAADLGADGVKAMVDLQLGPKAAAAGVTFSRLPADAVEQMLGQLQSGPVQGVLARMSADYADQLGDVLVDGIARGRSPRDVARRLFGIADTPRWKALQVARTETLRAYREAGRRSMMEDRDVLNGWTWHAQTDAGTCAVCWSMHGTQLPTAEVFATHPNCLPAGAVVTGPRVIGSTTRWYDGELVDLATASGRNLTVTPNHPVLTRRGWVAAGLIDEGDHLICGGLAERDAVDAGPDDYQRPALIEEVAETLGGALAVTSGRMPTAPEHFHGDGKGSEVHVVRSNGLLREGRNASPVEHGAKGELVVGRPLSDSLSGLSALALFLPAVLAPTRGFVRSRGVLGMLLGSAGGGHKSVRFGTAADAHASGDESTSHRWPRHAERSSDRVLGLASLVAGRDIGVGQGHGLLGAVLCGGHRSLLGSGAPGASGLEDVGEPTLGYAVPSRSVLARYAGDVVEDRVVNRTVRSWSGHVYNLETSEGWFLANGIVTHNCRCTALPRTKSYAELGIPGVEEPNPLQVTDGPTLFARQPVHVQRQVLGPGKLQAYQDGRFTLADVVGERFDRDWGQVRFERSLRDVVTAA